MSTLVLLDDKGLVAHKLRLVSLPDDYTIPEGMMVSWRDRFDISSSDIRVAYFGPIEPVEAWFYLGEAWGQVCRTNFKPVGRDSQFGPEQYGSRTLTVTVQGGSAKDVITLRDHIMHLINSRERWEVSNDLNVKDSPKTGFLSRLRKWWGQ